jgi:hypothetical protein
MHPRILIVLVLISVVVLGSGCSRSTKRTVYMGPGGTATVTDKGGNGKTVEVKTGEGKVTVNTEKKSITEKELGVPVYPGATVEVSGNYEGSAAGGQGSMQQTVLTTPDSFDKVSAFYKSNLKNVESSVNQNMGNGNMAMFSVKSADGGSIMVHVMTDKDKKVTQIQVMKMPKTK